MNVGPYGLTAAGVDADAEALVRLDEHRLEAFRKAHEAALACGDRASIAKAAQGIWRILGQYRRHAWLRKPVGQW